MRSRIKTMDVGDNVELSGKYVDREPGTKDTPPVEAYIEDERILIHGTLEAVYEWFAHELPVTLPYMTASQWRPLREKFAAALVAKEKSDGKDWI